MIRKPSNGYLYCFGLAAVSIGLIGPFFGDLYGIKNFLGLNIEVSSFILMFAVGFLARLIFWSRASERLQDTARTFVVIVLIATLIMVLIMTYLTLSTTGSVHGFSRFYTMTVELLLQIPNVLWLLRYRNE